MNTGRKPNSRLFDDFKVLERTPHSDISDQDLGFLAGSLHHRTGYLQRTNSNRRSYIDRQLRPIFGSGSSLDGRYRLGLLFSNLR